MAEKPATVIVLAGQRAGVVNPLAARAGTSHKCLVPICGRPLIAHVLDTLVSLPSVGRIRVSVEEGAHEEVGALLAGWSGGAVPIELAPAQSNIVDSVLAAAGDDPGPLVITTADNVLLTAEGFGLIRAALERADAAIGLTTRERVWAVHRAGQRRFYDFRDTGYASCNCFGLANREAFRAAEVFREGGQFQKNPRRMVRAFGLVNIVLMRLGLIGLRKGLERVGRRFGLRIEPVVFEDGALAIDVDNERTYRIAEWVLGQRLGMDIPKPDIDPAA